MTGWDTFNELICSQNRLSLPFWITVTVELLCVAFFLFRFLHELTFTRRDGFWRDAKHIVAMAIILLTVFDIAVSTGTKFNRRTLVIVLA